MKKRDIKKFSGGNFFCRLGAGDGFHTRTEARRRGRDACSSLTLAASFAPGSLRLFEVSSFQRRVGIQRLELTERSTRRASDHD